MPVVDTTELSEPMHPAPDAVIAPAIAERAISSLHLMAVSEAEMRFGLAIMPPEKPTSSRNFPRPESTRGSSRYNGVSPGAAPTARSVRYTVIATSSIPVAGNDDRTPPYRRATTDGRECAGPVSNAQALRHRTARARDALAVIPSTQRQVPQAPPQERTDHAVSSADAGRS